nr:cystatin-like fold lipoprotein [Listeria rustica]
MIVLTGVACLLILGACSNDTSENKYDKQIEMSIKECNEGFKLADMKRNLKRAECNFKVYNDGEYVLVEYPFTKNDDDLEEDLYHVVSSREMNLSNVGNVEGLKPDYVETNVQ